jgi:flagellar biosynthesis/type III secretory pathway protein FliH
MPPDTPEDRLETYMESAHDLFRRSAGRAEVPPDWTTLGLHVKECNRLPLMYLLHAFPLSEAARRHRVGKKEEETFMDYLAALNELSDGLLFKKIKEEAREEGREKGREEVREDVVRKMAAAGYSVEETSKMTGFDLSRIDSILGRQD